MHWNDKNALLNKIFIAMVLKAVSSVRNAFGSIFRHRLLNYAKLRRCVLLRRELCLFLFQSLNVEGRNELKILKKKNENM